MGRSLSRHLKRLPSPPHWPIHVKEAKWAFKPSPGPHAIKSCIPLAIAIRDMLNLAKNGREAKMIVSEGRAKVDGKIQKDIKYPLGLMDLVEIPDLGSYFRVLPIQKKGLRLIEVPATEASIKPCKIVGKTTTKNGLQLHLHDGRNILIKPDAAQAGRDYRVKDTVIIDLHSMEEKGRIRFSEGVRVLITAGRNMGRIGKLVEVVEASATRPAQASIEDAEGRVFQTIADYVFAVGEKEPIIKVAAE